MVASYLPNWHWQYSHVSLCKKVNHHISQNVKLIKIKVSLCGMNVCVHCMKSQFHVCCAAAPCAPEILSMTQTNSSIYRVLFTTPNTLNTNYTITAIGRYDIHTCNARNNSCELTQLPCGSTYEVTAVATTSVGRSLPGYSKPLETGMIKSYRV